MSLRITQDISRLTGAGRRILAIRSRFVFARWALLSVALLAPSCSIIATRPVQEMSDTQAAIKAAREAQADSQAPELYRQAKEWFYKAKREYRLKNFKLAKEYAKTARRLAEQAEFDAIRNQSSGQSDSSSSDQPTPPPPPAEPSDSNAEPAAGPADEAPAPTGTPVEVYEERKAAEDARRQKEMDKFNSQPVQQPASPPNPYAPNASSGSVPVSTSLPQPAPRETVTLPNPEPLPTATTQ